MINYVLRQMDGHILVESTEIQEIIKSLVKFKLSEFDRYNVSIDEKIEFERYPYMNDLYNLYVNSTEYEFENFQEVEKIYNNPLHISEMEFVKMEVVTCLNY